MIRFRRAAALLMATAVGGAALAASPMVGKPAPECPLAPIGDAPRFDAAARDGKVLYVDFWASWCAPCVRAFPFLNALEREFRDRGLRVVGINVDERPDDAAAFLRRYRANFAVARDPGGGACPKAFGVIGMPSSYLVDRRGIIREVHIGFRDGDAAERRAQVERLLAEPVPARAEGAK